MAETNSDGVIELTDRDMDAFVMGQNVRIDLSDVDSETVELKPPQPWAP